jgi:hypothetical protein
MATTRVGSSIRWRQAGSAATGGPGWPPSYHDSIRKHIMKALLISIFIVLSGEISEAAVVNDNCMSDQSAELQAAIDAMTTNITLPVGCIAISKPIYSKSWITLRGSGKRLTTLKALSTFQGAALVIIGSGLDSDAGSNRQLVFDSMISDLTLDTTSAPAGTSCAYMAGAQEGSGMQHDLCIGVKGATSDAIRIAGNVNRAAIRDIEIYPATAIRYGIVNDNAYCGCEISDITVGITNPLVAGIRVFDTNFTASRIHCAQAANCIQVDGNNSVGVISIVDGPTVLTTNGYLLFVAGASKIVAQGLIRNGYTHSVLSLFDPVNRADPYIGQIVINN